MSTQWNDRYARRLTWMTTSAIRDIFKYIQSKDIISLAGGWPEADLFPVDQIDDITHHVLREMPHQSLQYGMTDGFTPLREAIADWMTELGVPAKVENIAITSGSQQALDLMGRIFLNEGDTVLVESPTFLGATQAFNAYGVKYVTVPVTDEGTDPDAMERALQQHDVKFMYLIPTFQNPTGVTMSLQARRRVVEIAGRYGVPILEDDPYSMLRFAGEPVPSLIALDAERNPENGVARGYVKGNVVYLSSFSKTMAPGLRVAWAVCPPEIVQQFVMAKQGSDLQTNALAQTIAYEFMRRGLLPDQIRRIRDTYLERRNAMCEAIAEYFPPEVRCTRPEGGLFLWVVLPAKVDTVELLKEAVQHQVAFVPGRPFYVDGGGKSTLRLSYATVPPDTIREGIRRLGNLIRTRLEQA